MAPVIAPEPPTTASPTASEINMRGHPNKNRTPRRNLFRGKKKKIQGTPTPMKRAATKGAKLQEEKVSKPNYLPGDKVVSEKDMRLAIKALLLQKFLKSKMKE